MKHIHAEIIKAMADNTSLSLFCRDTYCPDNGWVETSQWPIQEDFDYFLCLPYHHVACVHWLNGGEVELRIDGEEEWIPLLPATDVEWCMGHSFMKEHVEIRIKPKTKKVWIGVFPWSHGELGYVVTEAYKKRAELAYEISKTWGDREYQAIAIEVEE